MTWRTVGLACVVSLLLALSLGSGIRAASAGPTVLAAHRDGSVYVDAFGWSTIVSLPLPQGNWVVYAKAAIASLDGVRCQLVVGQDIDDAHRDGETGEIALATVHHFDSAGAANLICQGPDTGGWVSWTKMVAVKVSKLKNQALPNGTVATWGSGTPLASAGWRDGPLAVSGQGVPAALATLKLPAGNWWVFAKLNAVQLGSRLEAEDVSCSLVLRDDAGSSSDVAVETIGRSRSSFVAMQQTRSIRSGGGDAKVLCASSGQAGGMEARSLKVVAIKTGTLESGPLGGAFSTAGSGTPRVRAGSKQGPIAMPIGSTITAGKLTLPGGKWAIVATAYAHDPVNGSGGVVACDLVAGQDVDRLPSIIVSELYLQRRAIVLIVVHDFGSNPGNAKLRCTADQAALELSSVRIIAIRAGNLTNTSF